MITSASIPINITSDGICGKYWVFSTQTCDHLKNVASLGLGFYTLSEGHMTPVVFNLWHQRLIDQPIVSFWLDPYELSFSDQYCEKKTDLEIQNTLEVERFSSVALTLNSSKVKSFMLM